MQESITQATHIAAMICFRKTLFGLGPKLTVVQKNDAMAVCL
jgi:hypothetical protein